MHATVPRSSPAAQSRLSRSYGRVSTCFGRQPSGPTRVRTLFQEGCLKARLPRPVSVDDAELVLINTAGGLTAGDHLSIEVMVEEEACATVTTPGSERIYRALQGEVVVEQKLVVQRAGRLDWLPQETILFDRGRLRRRFDIQVEDDARVTLVEAVLLGRTAMGETVQKGLLSDFWTVRRGREILFADAMHFTDPFATTVSNAATLGGLTALAMLLHVGAGLEPKRDALRESFSEDRSAVAGASIVGDVLVARIAASGIMPLRRALIPALAILRDGRPLPRLWTC